MRNLLLSLVAFGAVSASGAAPAAAQPAWQGPGLQNVQYDERRDDRRERWRGREEWRERREHEWRRGDEWRRANEWRGYPPVYVQPYVQLYPQPYVQPYYGPRY